MARSRMRIAAVACMTGMILAGCGQSTGSPAAPTAAAGSAAPSVPVAPSPSAGAATDVVPLFAAAIADVSEGVLEMAATARVGNIQFTLAGSQAFDGPDSSDTTTTTIAGAATTVETIEVAGKRYTRTGDGPWTEAPLSAKNDVLEQLVKNADSSMSDVGTETREGQLVHRLEVAGSAFDPAALLSNATGVSDAAGTVVFFCTDDGTPVGAEIELTWKQQAGGQTADASMTLEMSFSQLGVAQTIVPPDEVWSVHTSSRYEYSIAYPSDYDFSKDKDYDYFFGPGLVDFYGVSRVDRQDLSLNIIAKSEVDSIKAYLGTRKVSNDAISMGGLEGRLLSASGNSADQGKVLVYEVLVIKGQWVYYLAWFSEPGNEAADEATLRQAVSSFRFTS